MSPTRPIGPNSGSSSRSSSSSSSIGGESVISSRVSPESVLEEGKVFAAAGRADVLVVRSGRQLVLDAKGGFDLLEVLDVEAGGKRLAAAETAGRSLFGALA